MVDRKQDFELRNFQTIVPGADLETLKNFRKCMGSTDNIKNSIALAVAGGILTYFSMPKRTGALRPWFSYTVSFGLYLIGRAKRGHMCYKEALNSTIPPEEQERVLLENYRQFGYKIGQQEPEIHSSESASNFTQEPASNFTQESPMWSNYDDSQFESTSNEFSDTPDYFKEEEPIKKPTVEKKRVTYEELWLQHRLQETDKKRSNDKSSSAPKSKQESTIFVAEDDNKNVWN